MRSFGELFAYSMPLLLLVGPILLMFGETYFPLPLLGAVCLGLGLFTLSIKVDLILNRLKQNPTNNQP